MLAIALTALAAPMGASGHSAPVGASGHPAPVGASGHARRARARSVHPVTVTLTTANLRRALSSMPAVGFGRIRPNERTIWVDPGVRYQSVAGFGAAMTDSSAWLLYDELPARTRANVMADLFGSDGIGLNYVRVPMGASDFTVSGVPYSYDDLPAGQGDPTLADFSIAHDDAYILPALQRSCG